jgi:hypothetical protein
MKKIIKQFRLPFKSNSPHLKKKLSEHPNHPQKAGLSSSKPAKKKLPVQTKPTPKNQTETGPLIKKVSHSLFRKRHYHKKQRRS